MEIKLNSIEEVVEDLKLGKIVIVVDDENRENEGDFILAAEKTTPEKINFISKYGRGIICSAITSQRANELSLDLMVERNTSLHETPFTISVDYIHGTTTGVSAFDRAKTVLSLVDEATKPNDLARPGHIFPLKAMDGGVLRRTGHTEASVDLCKIANLKPIAVLCEILHEDGTMAKLSELFELAKKFNLKITSVKSLIEFRMQKEKLVHKIVSTNLPTEFGDFQLHIYKSETDANEHIALVKGKILPNIPTLVRVHSECLTGDVFHSLRCDCKSQLNLAMYRVAEEGNGIILYMRQEGRGIGLLNKIKAYKLQDEGFDTVEANQKLGFSPDLRDYGIGAQILRDLNVSKMRLLTNNPKKIVGLSGYGLEVIERVPLEVVPNGVNEKYLKIKRDKLGHYILLDKKKK